MLRLIKVDKLKSVTPSGHSENRHLLDRVSPSWCRGRNWIVFDTVRGGEGRGHNAVEGIAMTSYLQQHPCIPSSCLGISIRPNFKDKIFPAQNSFGEKNRQKAQFNLHTEPTGGGKWHGVDRSAGNDKSLAAESAYTKQSTAGSRHLQQFSQLSLLTHTTVTQVTFPSLPACQWRCCWGKSGSLS